MENESKYLSVSDFSEILKIALERTFPQTIYLKGEISGYKPSSTGHWYLSIKDENALISAIVFKNTQKTILEAFKKSGINNLRDGQEVLVEGKLNFYKKNGSYTIIISSMKPLGIGELYVRFEKLKKDLQALGYFDQSIKKEIPKHPRVIGIVTSPTGAALQDMINVLNRRAPGIAIKIFPVAVQGENAKKDIVKAIRYASFQYINKLKDSVDILILARGGGSIEDLWSFNERIVAEAIYECPIPLISGVGHEVDFSISDFCSDLRAPTPSAAAELVSKSSDEIIGIVNSFTLRIEAIIRNKLDLLKKSFEQSNQYVLNRSIQRLYQKQQQDSIYFTERMVSAFTHSVKDNKHKFLMVQKSIDAMHPLHILNRGYAMVYRQPNNKLVTSVVDANSLDKISIVLKDGTINSTID